MLEATSKNVPTKALKPCDRPTSPDFLFVNPDPPLPPAAALASSSPLPAAKFKHAQRL
jgi:hypothetical protein